MDDAAVTFQIWFSSKCVICGPKIFANNSNSINNENRKLHGKNIFKYHSH